MNVHELKTWPEFFQAVSDGRKPFEYRFNDRNYQVGDVLWLREWVPPPDPFEEGGGFYTGREERRKVTYILDGRLGPTLKAGFVIIALGPE